MCFARGVWICKNNSGMVGFVSTKDVGLDAASVRTVLDRIPKPEKVMWAGRRESERDCVCARVCACVSE